MREIEKIFDEINEEARTGIVKCGIKEYLYYSFILEQNGVVDYYPTYECYDDVIPPCLKIYNKEELLTIIESYVSLAKDFYTDMDYYQVTNLDKFSIASVLTNMALDDFDNPIDFFNKRNNFLTDSTLEEFKEKQVLGYSLILDADIELEIKKEPIFMETPYGIYISITRKVNNKILKYNLPTIRYGISDGTAYIYAIQKDQSEVPDSNVDVVQFQKIIRRKLYSVDKGLTTEEKEDDSFFNIHEISPWALVALSITLGLFHSKGISKVIAPPILLNRRNASHLYTETEIKLLKELGNEQDLEVKKIIEEMENQRDKLDNIQKNITDKFIRTFRRLDRHFSEIVVDDYPVTMGLPLKMFVSSGECNNPLLQEMFNIGCNKNELKFERNRSL